MKKNIVKTLLFIFLVLSMPISSYANNPIWMPQSDYLHTQTQTVVSNDNTSKVRGTARGRVLSLAELELSDQGNGVLGVYAETLCHNAVKEIYMSIYLDVWDESRQDWVTLNSYDYEWKAADRPNEDLTDVSVSFSIEGLARGKTYSLRGLHSARGFDNMAEIMATETDGIVLD